MVGFTPSALTPVTSSSDVNAFDCAQGIVVNWRNGERE